MVIELSAVMLVNGDLLVKYATKLLDDSQFKEVKENIENSFNCCGFNITVPLDYMIVCLEGKGLPKKE